MAGFSSSQAGNNINSNAILSPSFTNKQQVAYLTFRSTYVDTERQLLTSLSKLNMARGGAGKGDGENTKKKPSASAKKAEKQQNAEKQQKAVAEDQEWSKGQKSNAKK